MSVTTQGAIAELKHKPGRLAAVMLAIVIGSMFAVATTVFASTAGRAVEVAVAESLQNADIVVRGGSGSGESLAQQVDADIQALTKTPGVVAVAPMLWTRYELPGSGSLTGVRVQAAISDQQLAYEKLASGTMPKTATEIALDPDTAKEAGVRIGGNVTLRSIDKREATFTVTGITKPNETTRNLAGRVSWASVDFLKQDPTAGVSAYIVRTDGDPEAVAATMRSNLPAGLIVSTGQDARAELVQAVSGGTVAITALLGIFAAIALAVAAVVIANTFAILLAQRRRQIALKRLVGATSRQMSRQILIEALLIGVTGTVVGTGLGIATGYIGANTFGAAAGGLTINPWTVAGAAVATVLATVAAAYFPIRRACKTSPIEALRPSSQDAEGARFPRWRIAVSAVLIIVGLGCLGLAAKTYSPGLGALGGMLSVVGLLFSAQLLVIPLGKLLRPLGAIAGVPGRIAARDVTRHASRATNTVVAMIVGVGLISMIQVASQITRATALAGAEDSDLRKQIEAVVDIMTNVATGLLAVTAIIAVVGIANTLALSVIERKRESGLLRALGVQKGQLRSMISVEAVILALIGGLVGVLLGLAYGTLAAYTVIGEKDALVWDIPWDRLAIFLAIALIGGLVASVLPAVRSGRVSPVEALATE